MRGYDKYKCMLQVAAKDRRVSVPWIFSHAPMGAERSGYGEAIPSF